MLPISTALYGFVWRKSALNSLVFQSSSLSEKSNTLSITTTTTRSLKIIIRIIATYIRDICIKVIGRHFVGTALCWYGTIEINYTNPHCHQLNVRIINLKSTF